MAEPARFIRDPALDGLRGIAALWVFLVHATYSGYLAPIFNFRGSGRGGVILFFFLSAFLLSAPFFLNLRRALSFRSWVQYWIRRLFRIVPLYYLVLLAAYALLLKPFDGSGAAANLFDHFTFQRGDLIYWTIVVEMRFYLFLQVFMLAAAAAFGWFRHWPLIVLLPVSLWLAGVAGGVVQGSFVTLKIDRHAPIFIAGIFTSLLVFGVQSGKALISKRAAECGAWLFAVLFFWQAVPALHEAVLNWQPISAYIDSHRGYEAYWDRRIPWIGLLLAGFFFFLSCGAERIRSLLSSRMLVWLGRISFGVYLIHSPMLDLVQYWQVPRSYRFISAAALTFALASLLYRTVEAPCISYARRITSANQKKMA